MGKDLIATGHTIMARRFTSITATGIMAMVGIIRTAGGITKEGTQSKIGLSEYKDDSGKSNPMYFLDFHASMVLVTGYDAKKRSAVINRGMALEQGVASPQKALSTEGRGLPR